MDRLKQLNNNTDARTEIVQAIQVLRKYDVFSALLWRASTSVSADFSVGDTEKMALSGALSAGYKKALIDLDNPFANLPIKEEE